MIRNSGLNVTYQYYFCPPGLAVALGDQGQVDSIPTWSMQKAAFYAVNQSESVDFSRQIDEYCKIAEEANGDCELIRHFAGFDFENFERPKSIIVMPDRNELADLIGPFREENSYRSPRDMQIHLANTLAEVLLSTEPEDVKQRVAMLEEARLMSMRAGDAPRAEDAVLEMALLAEIDKPNVMTDSLMTLTRSRLEPMQTRGLMEIAIPFVKSSLGKQANKQKRSQLMTRLAKIAKDNEMIDCLRRLEQSD